MEAARKKEVLKWLTQASDAIEEERERSIIMDNDELSEWTNIHSKIRTAIAIIEELE